VTATLCSSAASRLVEILMVKLSGYRHDVFLSYSRAQSWPVFVNNHFRPVFDHWMTSELGAEVRVFQDVHIIQVGQQWPREIARGLSESRVMVALLSRNYFQSEWCRRELAAMLARAEWLRNRNLDDNVIFPLAMHDCHIQDLPEVVRSLQILSLHRYADPFMHPESMLREELSHVMRPLCEQIAGRLAQMTNKSFRRSLPDDTEYRARLMPANRARPAMPVLSGDS
jgi:hypothetical protein